MQMGELLVQEKLEIEKNLMVDDEDFEEEEEDDLDDDEDDEDGDEDGDDW